MRHTLAVLRTTIGLTQKEMAAIVECSTPTIQAIELGKLHLSQKLAERIALQTGVSLKWLFANETSKPPLDSQNGPVTKETFIQTQAELRRPQNTPDDAWRCKQTYLFAVELVGNVLLRALEQGRVDLYVYKLLTTLEELSVELGEEPFHETYNLNIRAKREDDATWKAHFADPYFSAEAAQQFFERCDHVSKKHSGAAPKKPPTKQSSLPLHPLLRPPHARKRQSHPRKK